jgi:tetratricopeptide (TPR) repeat protein
LLISGTSTPRNWASSRAPRRCSTKTRPNARTKSRGSSAFGIFSRRASDEPGIACELRHSSSTPGRRVKSGSSSTNVRRRTSSHGKRGRRCGCTADDVEPWTDAQRPGLQDVATVEQFTDLRALSPRALSPRQGSAEELHKAQEHFRKAIELDPSYARAYSGLADIYALLGSYDVMRIGESHPLGRQAALKALELDDSLAEARRSLAAILADYYWEWADADRHFKRAIELGPNDATTLRSYAFHLAYTGRPVEALPLAEQARSLDPLSPNARINLGSVLFLGRHFDDAVREFEEALDLDANLAFARALLGLTYVSKGMPDRAVAEVQTARALSARPDVIAFHGYILARAGRRREALKDLDDLHRLASPRGPSPFLVALVYTGLEDNDRAFDWLAKAVERRAWEMPTLKASPVFDRLRSDPRFPALLDRVGLPR